MPTLAELKAALTDPAYYRQVGGGLLDAYNRGAVGGLLGAPVDMANGVLNAGKMAAGYAGNKLGLLSGDQMPQPDMMPVGGSEWIGQKMQDAGMVSPNRNMPAEMLAGLAGIPLTAMAAAKAGPMVEKGIGQAMANAQMPSTLNLPQYSGQRGAIAYHGSPHKFDKFKSEAIGTGEGAQAYGHGLYLAESPDVARSYHEALTTLEPVLKRGGQVIDLFKDLKAPNFDYEIPLSEIHSLMKTKAPIFGRSRPGLSLEEAMAKVESSKIPNAKELVALLRSNGIDAIDSVPSSGALYKTDIPDEAVARFLDWDKPLSQQAPEVRSALQSMVGDVTKGGFDLSRSPRNVSRAFDNSTSDNALKALQEKYGVSNSGGQYFDKNGNPLSADVVQHHVDKIAGKGYDNAGQLYSDLMHIVGSQSDVSATLRNNGIPGIRYLDGGSRSTGAGTSNYVAFDPEMIRILERNGQPTGLLPWQPGEWGNK